MSEFESEDAHASPPKFVDLRPKLDDVDRKMNEARFRATEMNIGQHDTKTCPGCGTSEAHFNERTCSYECRRTSTTTFVVTTYLPSEAQPPPHLHVKCAHCQFEWLEHVRDLNRLMTLW